RDLAEARPEAFTPNLAMSLNNLASFLSNLGQREAALEAAKEAVALYRDLAEARPEAFTPNLAMSLNNLASFLSNLGQREAALEAAKEA
ncbi:tetratricopeptide repeat protein, partial [Rhodovulum sulfidophilum]|uniref:tetratricopeptide repeat protein n=1 Tax=Rhodovulum sulfidophilum TaxID=35806 RepID=UPI001921AED6